MYKTARIRARPPHTVRLPRSCAAVPVEGSHSHEGGDLPAVQRAQLRQIGQESHRETFPDSGNTAQQVVLLSPNGTLAESLPQALVQVVQLTLQPCNVGLDAGTHGDGGGTQAVLLRDQHGHHLVPAGDQRVEGLGLGVPVEGAQAAG